MAQHGREATCAIIRAELVAQGIELAEPPMPRAPSQVDRDAARAGIAGPKSKKAERLTDRARAAQNPASRTKAETISNAVGIVDAMHSSSLPQACTACAFFVADANGALGTCTRHAPSTSQNEFEIVHWPKVLPTDRCGVGVSITHVGACVVYCQACVHWLQPRGSGVVPEYRQGSPMEWWAESGICTRFAPSPVVDDDTRIYWRVTHSSSHCGDGEALE